LKPQLQLKQAILTLLLLVLMSITGFAQGIGKISGTVTDQKTGETLIGVTVKITGTIKGAATDIEGRYTISNLAAGKYSVEASYIGYSTKRITDIEVKPGAAVIVNLVMEDSNSQKLNEVVITASVKQESVNALYASQKNSARISSGITADQIRRSPDKNTSEVLKRVSGASVQDGKFLVIRGLSDRYNVALINNSLLPSTEPDKRAFSFDIIPSNMIDRIVINKTASPDLPGDFAGGVTQVITKDIPDNNFITFSAATGFNTNSTFKDFFSNSRNGLDFLGFDDGSRSLPTKFPSSRSVYNRASTAQKIAYSKLFPNAYGEVSSTALPMQNYQVTWGNVAKYSNGGVFGSILSFNYRKEQNIRDAERESFDGVNFINKFNDQNYRYNVALGALANFSYKKGKNKVSFKNLFNQSFEDNYVSRLGFINQNTDIRYNSSELNQKSLLSSQLEGEHQIGEKNWKLDWNLNYALTTREQPDLRSILYSSVQGSNAPFSLVDDFTRRFFSDLTENNYGGNISLSVPFELFTQKSTAKFGVLKQKRDREFDSRTFLYGPANSSQFDASKNTLPRDVIFAPENISSTGFALDEITNNSDSYTGETDLNAGYVMLDNALAEKVRLVWGARIEDYSQSIKTINSSGSSVKYNKSFLDVLPSFNLTYALTPKTNFRLSGSRTVSRPELRELAPFVFINQEEGVQIGGNPNLVRSQNTNADIRFETYPSAGEAFTLSLFYKNFDNPIEQVTDGSSTPDNLKFSYQNADKAYTYGFEIDMRKKLNFIYDAAWTENMIAFINFTYLKSQVESKIPGFQKRQLQGLSPYLLNAGLQYASPKSGISFNALYNRIGNRIAKVGNPNIPNFYEKGRDVVDLQVAKSVLKGKAEIKLSVSDVFNQSVVTYLNYGPDNKTFNRADDVVYYGYKGGTNFTLGFTYNLNLKSK
jgi:outer membrane receptor protein involved in Fe transport